MINMESRAVRPDNKLGVKVEDLKPAGRSSSQDVAEVLEEATEGTYRPKAIEPKGSHNPADEGLPEGRQNPTARQEGNAARQALDKATPPRPGRGWQKHHLIPWELRTHDAVYEYERLVAKIDNPQSARNIGKRAINSKFNNLTLPSSENSIGAEGLTIHRGSHLQIYRLDSG